LIECLAEHLKMARMIPVRLDNLADMLTIKRGPKLVGIEELAFQYGRYVHLVALLSVTLAA
jgi:hypothetical protein